MVETISFNYVLKLSLKEKLSRSERAAIKNYIKIKKRGLKSWTKYPKRSDFQEMLTLSKEMIAFAESLL